MWRRPGWRLDIPAGSNQSWAPGETREVSLQPPLLPSAFRNEEIRRERTDVRRGSVVDAAGRVQGIFTDGDLRRLIEKGVDLRGKQARDLMHPNPRTIRESTLAAEAAQMMEQHRITSVLVVDAEGVLVGAVNTNDLMRAKVI